MPELDFKNNDEVQVPVLSNPFISTLPKPNLKFKLNDPAKFNPSSGVQTINISPFKPKVSLIQNINDLPTSSGPKLDDKNDGEAQVPVQSKPFTSKLPGPNINFNISPLKPMVSLLPNIHNFPTSSSIKVFQPFGGSVVNPNADHNVSNATKATGLSTHTFDGERAFDNNVSLPSKNQDENQGVAGSKNLNNTILKSSAFTIIQKNKTALPVQTGLKALSFQGVTNNINNFIKAPNENGATSLSASNPQLATYSNNEKVASQKSGAEEDKMIQDGIAALQHRLQAPLQISAVAKSRAGCKERLCKEKVKTQQAKTREIISNQGKKQIQVFLCFQLHRDKYLSIFFRRKFLGQDFIMIRPVLSAKRGLIQKNIYQEYNDLFQRYIIIKKLLSDHYRKENPQKTFTNYVNGNLTLVSTRELKQV